MSSRSSHSFGALLEEVERRRLTFVVYGREEEFPALEQFTTRNVSVEHRLLPETGPDPFVVIRDSEGFVGSVPVPILERLSDPRHRLPWAGESDPGYRALLELLESSLFTAFDRRQLLAASREFEDRMWRVGQGRAHVGFQSADALRAQAPVYERLATERDLDVHVYVRAGTEPPEIPGVTLHQPDADEIGRFWFLVYDGGSDGQQACALVAEERAADSFTGVWTYDPATVGGLLGYLTDRYGDGEPVRQGG